MGRYSSDKQTEQIEKTLKRGSRIHERDNKPKSLKEQLDEYEKKQGEIPIKKIEPVKKQTEFMGSYVPPDRVVEIEERQKRQEEWNKQRRARVREQKKLEKENEKTNERKLIPLKKDDE